MYPSPTQSLRSLASASHQMMELRGLLQGRALRSQYRMETSLHYSCTYIFHRIPTPDVYIYNRRFVYFFVLSTTRIRQIHITCLQQRTHTHPPVHPPKRSKTKQNQSKTKQTSKHWWHRAAEKREPTSNMQEAITSAPERLRWHCHLRNGEGPCDEFVWYQHFNWWRKLLPTNKRKRHRRDAWRKAGSLVLFLLTYHIPTATPGRL